MAEIRPFRALRFTPTAGKIDQLICPPYDIISEQQRKQYLKTNPHNIVRLELPRDGEEPYEKAGKTLNEWLEQGILKQDQEPALYVYEIEFTLEGRDGIDGTQSSIMGLIGSVKLEEFEKGVVLPHEHTLSKAKTDRFNLMKATNCNFSSIYALYTDDPGERDSLDIKSLIKNRQPTCETEDDQGLKHRLWTISDRDTIFSVQKHLADKKLYIADGHHRYETALNYRNYMRERGVSEGADYVMMVMVEMSHPGLVVFPTHRLVRGLENFHAQSLIDSCSRHFDVYEDKSLSQIDKVLDDSFNNNNHAFGFYTGGDTFTLLKLRDNDIMDRLLPTFSPALRTLDVTVLHTLILDRMLGIDNENMAQQKNLTYTRDISKAVEEVSSGNFQCAFFLNPTRVSEIRDVAAAGEKMPQKSTYFYPKLITGMTMNKLF